MNLLGDMARPWTTHLGPVLCFDAPLDCCCATLGLGYLPSLPCPMQVALQASVPCRYGALCYSLQGSHDARLLEVNCAASCLVTPGERKHSLDA